MNISSSKSPYLLQIERSNRPKATYGNRFRIALNSEKAESQVSETAEEEEATQEFSTEDPNADFALPAEEESKDEYCYNITDEEAEYFLEKYGEKFNDSDPFKLFDELAETQDDVDPLQVMEEMTGKISASKPSYTVTEEQAEYFREKYGEEYDEEKPCQLFYELAEKKIISYDDAANASGFSRIFSEYMRQQGTWKEHFSNHNTYGCYNSYYERFIGKYDKEINTWQDVAQREYDFMQYLIDLDERLVTPDGTYFQSSKEQMNVGFQRECEGILKVKDVLSQIFGEATL